MRDTTNRARAPTRLEERPRTRAGTPAPAHEAKQRRGQPTRRSKCDVFEAAHKRSRCCAVRTVTSSCAMLAGVGGAVCQRNCDKGIIRGGGGVCQEKNEEGRYGEWGEAIEMGVG